MRVRNDNAHVETAKGVLFLKDFKIAGLDRERLKLVLKSPAREFHMAQVDVSDAGAVASIADRDKESFLCAPNRPFASLWLFTGTQRGWLGQDVAGRASRLAQSLLAALARVARGRRRR